MTVADFVWGAGELVTVTDTKTETDFKYFESDWEFFQNTRLTAREPNCPILWLMTRHRQVTDLDVTVLGFAGPGLPSARQVLCGDAPRLFFLSF